MASLRTGIIAATTEDLHGEKYDRDFLQFLRDSMPEKFPLHQQHDMARPTVGYTSNPRIVPLEGYPGEWALIVDIEIEEYQEINFTGLSWSATQGIEANSENPEVALYFPYPYYKDENQLRWFLEQNHPVAIGRWIKKGAEPLTVVLVAVLTPVWASTWNKIVYPAIQRQLPKLRQLWQKNFSTDLTLEVTTTFGEECTVYFIPERGMEEAAFRNTYMKYGLKVAIEHIEQVWSKEARIVRMAKLIFDPRKQRYRVFYLQYDNGEALHVVS